MPLSDASMSSGHSRSGEGVTSPSPSLKLAYDPTVLTSSSVQLKLLAHLSGAAYLFRLCPTSTPKYSVSMLHHNKTLDVDVSVETIQGGDEPCDTQLHLDVGLYSKGKNRVGGHCCLDGVVVTGSDGCLLLSLHRSVSRGCGVALFCPLSRRWLQSRAQPSLGLFVGHVGTEDDESEPPLPLPVQRPQC